VIGEKDLYSTKHQCNRVCF